MTCLKHPSWGRALLSLQQSSNEIIFIELGTVQKILVGWRRFYFHQQIHVHVTRPHHNMSFCIISCHVVSRIRHVFQFSSRVKGLLISFMEWCDAYFLGQIFMNSCVIEFMCKWGGQKGLNPSWESTFFKPIRGGGDQNLIRHLTKLLANGP